MSSWKKGTGSFIRKPTKGWIHPDYLIESSCVTYETRYIGSVKILESVKTIPFEQRGTLVREAIVRCCTASKLFEGKKRKKSEIDPVINSRLGSICLDHVGSLTSTTFSKSCIKTYIMQTGENIFDHNIQCISFASIGEKDFKSLIGYISKDETLERACFVFDCKGSIADDIILTIGQAFELKYKEFLNSNINIQPVIKGFTDPAADTSECGSFDNHVMSCDRNSSQYAELFCDETDLSSSVKSAPGYHALKKYDNTQISSISPSDSDLSFSPCPIYDGRSVNSEAIYDNPSDNMEATSCSYSDEDMFEIEGHNDDNLNLNAKGNKDTSGNCSDTTASFELMNKQWFHGKISRGIAEKCIKCDGDFLVRESTTSTGQFVLSGMREGSHRHILLVDPAGKVTTKDRTFNDIPELIKFHSSQGIPIFSGHNSEVYLNREIPNTAI